MKEVSIIGVTDPKGRGGASRLAHSGPLLL